MDLILYSPAVPEAPGRDHECTDNERRKVVFGLHGASCGHFHGVRRGKDADEDDSKDQADAETEICETRFGGAETISVFEDGGEGGEEKVQVGIEEGGVQCENGDDG